MQDEYQHQSQAEAPQDFSSDMNKACTAMKVVAFVLLGIAAVRLISFIVLLVIFWYEYTFIVGILMIVSDAFLILFHIALALLILLYSTPATRFKGELHFFLYVGTSALVLSLIIGVLIWNTYTIIDFSSWHLEPMNIIFYIIEEIIFIALAAHYIVFFFIYFRYYKLTRFFAPAQPTQFVYGQLQTYSQPPPQQIQQQYQAPQMT
jgi:hypothetical protein